MLPSSVIGYAADLAVNAFNEGGLKMLFMKSNLGEHVVGSPYGKSAQASAWITRAMHAARDGDITAQEGLEEFVRLVAERLAPTPPEEHVEPGTPFWVLRESTRSAGLDLRVDTFPGAGIPRVRLLPLDDPRAPLSEEVTALEADLARSGQTVALSLYRQAVKNFVDQDFEAANGMLRTAFEAVITHVAGTVGFQQNQQGDGGNAIRYLRDNGHLPERDGGDFIRGLWWITHTNGPHPGTTTAGEVHFRLLTITGAIRYLIDRFC